ncbi:site-2 protease family protein [Microlunatus panaciterrae]|uniref:Membrane-associated protease RseP (Regulator of RpoE activity) n=1 Tax=Microlunatus panaciterrae TaxID=400768 RepID=A0ABS2RMS5_9ACTN|nr:site-2 protease family protein [Microlunatus panaciterrae]MBM7800315.1 membrane-associated protease RseP (regulator of RpoE activity) [Microlunatus panaciterrae]
MDIVIYILGAVLFFALVMASIALHEVGHLVPGKLFGVKTTQYFVGFGKTLWARRFGETEFGVKALPLGGYVRFVGMYPPSKEAPTKVMAARTGIFQSLADQARSAEWEDITPEDEGRLFYQKKTWQKLIIMAGGPAMNILLAFLILLAVTGLYGMPRTQLTVSHVSECIVPASRADQTCRAGDPKTPAFQAGVRPGDKIVAFNGQRITSWDQMSELIRANLDHRAVVTVERSGQRVDLAPVNTVITGVPHKWDPSRTVQAGFFGVSPDQALERGGPIVVLQDMWRMTRQTGYALVRFPAKVYFTAANLVTGKPRDVYGPMSIVGASRVAGEVAATDKINAADKVATLFSLLGSVNLFVALFNFVPLLPLDGGHIAGALYEGLRRWLAKLLGRPDPGHVDTAKMLPVAYVVGGIIALSGAVLILADIIDPIKLL